MGIQDQTHCFFLQSPRDGDPDARHHNRVSVGHAVSKDLYHWDYRGTILSPGEEGCWDDLSIWTGFMLNYAGQYYLFYTGRGQENFWEQKIGLAVSEDLVHFQRVSESPILVPDPELYDTTGTEQNEVGNPPTWRDPYVIRDEEREEWVMVLSARSNPPGLYNGCIGYARSTNLVDWETLPPLLDPRKYDEMETPQLLIANGKYYLFFSTWARCYSPDFSKEVTPASGLHGYVANNLEGPYQPINQNGIILGNGDYLYSVRMAAYLRDRHMAMGWLNFDRNSEFIGRLSNPLPMSIQDDQVTPDYTS